MSSGATANPPIPMLDLRAQYASIREEIHAALDEVLKAQHFILGPNVELLEKEIAAYCGSRFAVGVASGTDALILALHAAGVGPGDEVLVPSFSYIATADSVSLLGATPVFVDIQAETFCLDPARLEAKVSPRTRAVVAVHLFGQSADMDPILAFAHRHGLQVIEDNAQSIGATYHSKRTGSIGDFGGLSFFPTKNLGGYGDAGMILTDSGEAYNRLRSLRSHGSIEKYISYEQGWNSRLDELQAAVLRVKLRHLDKWRAARRSNVAAHNARLESLPGVVVPQAARWGEHVFHQYTIRVPKRQRVQRSLAEEGIASTVYYPVPIHLQPIYRNLAHRPGDLPESERAASEVLSLPMYPELTESQIERICGVIARGLK
jgi:dTDP-4-amino-4,6-dideoxygalactose transaminase